MDIVHAKLSWQSAMAKWIKHESFCPCVSLNRYFLFSCFPTIFVNKWKRWSTMAKGIRHVSLCPCVRVMLPSLSFLPTLPTHTGPTSTLYSVSENCTLCPTPKCSLSELNFKQEIVLTGNSQSWIEPNAPTWHHEHSDTWLVSCTQCFFATKNIWRVIFGPC